MLNDLNEWVNSERLEGFNDNWIEHIQYLNNHYTLEIKMQNLCIRKMFEAHKRGLLKINANTLKRLLNNGRSLTVDVYVAIQIVLSVIEKGEISSVWEIYNTLRNVYKGYKNETFYKLMLRLRYSDLFEHCSGYSILREIPNDMATYHNMPIGYMTFEKDGSCKISFYDDRSAISESTFRQTVSHYTIGEHKYSVPLQYRAELVNFLRDLVLHKEYKKQRFVAIAGLQMWGNHSKSYTGIMSYSDKFRTFAFCEGKIWDGHQLGNCYWCGGSACFCKGIQFHENLKEYTLLDFIRIIDSSKCGDLQKSYSAYNRLHTLVTQKHLECKECGVMLEPIHDKGYNGHRVVKFKCTNQDCNFLQEVYLNHCFQEKCNAVIDSRETRKCENGFYICPQCGVCCAESQFQRKLAARVELGDKIASLIYNHKMHLDGQSTPQFFCPKCGAKLIEKVESNIKYLECPNHSDYYGVFPRSFRNSETNKRLKSLKETPRVTVEGLEW